MSSDTPAEEVQESPAEEVQESPADVTEESESDLPEVVVAPEPEIEPEVAEEVAAPEPKTEVEVAEPDPAPEVIDVVSPEPEIEPEVAEKVVAPAPEVIDVVVAEEVAIEPEVDIADDVAASVQSRRRSQQLGFQVDVEAEPVVVKEPEPALATQALQPEVIEPVTETGPDKWLNGKKVSYTFQGASTISMPGGPYGASCCGVNAWGSSFEAAIQKMEELLNVKATDTAPE
jgi:hypothetical protein